MTERFERARQLGRRLDAEWQREDVEAQLAQLHARQRTRTRRRSVGTPLAAAVITATVFVGVFASTSARRETVPPPAVAGPADVAVDRRARDVETSPPVTPPPVSEGLPLASGVLSLGDGSVVTPLSKDSRLLARRVSETDVIVALTGGGARFDVPDRQARRFRADLGALALETHGAAFRVRITRRQIEVIAERGEVSARSGRERQLVAAGETRTFAMAAHDDVPRVDHDEPIPVPEPPSSWRDDAGRGDFAAAWVAFERAPGSVSSMQDLLLAGDVARLSGHPAAAVALLSRAAALHPEDPRAPLAAFTLGRVQLEDLGAPRDAALAFARARELAPDGPLVEDALAREVEAWSRAGEMETARSRARTYMQRYPQGHRAHAVRRFGMLEPP